MSPSTGGRTRIKGTMKPIKGIFFREFEQGYIPEILEEIYKHKVYDPYIRGKKDLTIIDFGANIGLWTHYAYDSAKIIYSVEPSAEHYECLVTMCISNEMHNVAPIKKAISNSNGSAKFYHNANTTMYSLNQAVSQGESEEVETITLDKFFEENKIEHVDFVKMDIEGAEAEVFGGEGFDKVKDKIDVIMGEFHTWTGINPEQFVNYFRDRGFKFRWMNQTSASLYVAERIK